jgi:hypothetical protein
METRSFPGEMSDESVKVASDFLDLVNDPELFGEKGRLIDLSGNFIRDHQRPHVKRWTPSCRCSGPFIVSNGHSYFPFKRLVCRLRLTNVFVRLGGSVQMLNRRCFSILYICRGSFPSSSPSFCSAVGISHCFTGWDLKRVSFVVWRRSFDFCSVRQSGTKTQEGPSEVVSSVFLFEKSTSCTNFYLSF